MSHLDVILLELTRQDVAEVCTGLSVIHARDGSEPAQLVLEKIALQLREWNQQCQRKDTPGD